MEQMTMLPSGRITRSQARADSLQAARARAEAGAACAGAAADAASDGWCDRAAEKLRVFARAQDGVFTIEMARAGLAGVLDQPPDLRAWGKATRIAITQGYIQRVPRTFLPAASSNGSPKPAWKRGASA